MKVCNKILENLRNSIKLQSLDDDTIERIVNGNMVRLYKCDECGNIFSEDSTVSIRTDMESYYGVGSDFPDHHYENLSGCPNCNSTDIEELGLYELEDFEDYEVFTEGWVRIAGPKRKTMDNKQYQLNIMKKLIPMLHQYGIEMSLYPSKDAPGYQIYNGYYNNKRIDFKFINGYKPSYDYRNGKYDMTVKIHCDGVEETAGVINLQNEEFVEEAFEIITKTLEDMNIITSNNKEQETKDDNEDLDNLLVFKKGLSEQELLEIEK